MRTALDYCGHSGIAKVKLDATLLAETCSRLRVRAVDVGAFAGLPSTQIVRYDTKSSGSNPSRYALVLGPFGRLL